MGGFESKCALLVLTGFFAAGVGTTASGAELPAAVAPEVPIKTVPAPGVLAKDLAPDPFAVLAPAEIAVPAEVEAIAAWNAAGQKPTKIGLVRPLPVPGHLELEGDDWARYLEGPVTDPRADKIDGAADLLLSHSLVQETEEGLVWATRLRIEGAQSLQARLSRARLPEGAQLWVYGEDLRSIHFGAELIRPDGDLWTPAVEGETLHLEILVPRSALESAESLGFEIDQLAQTFHIDSLGAPILEKNLPDKVCTESAACWTSQDSRFDGMKQATAHMRTTTSNGVFICSGTLMNTQVGDFTPYFLTANHCLDNQNDATSTSFYFDFIPAFCGGPDPSLFSLPRVNGAVLLANRPASDSSFLELFAQPGGARVFAGWTTAPPLVGSPLRSFSHPNGRSMRYSRTIRLAGGGCGLGTDEYIFSDQDVGGVQGGSSGSHIVNSNFQVVGQLRGACGINPTDGCLVSLNDRVDGQFASFFPSIQQWLLDNGPECIENDTTMCLNGDRFEVRATYQTQNGGVGNGQGFELTSDTGYFWFFDSSNVEVVIKVLEACDFNGKFWVFAGGLTDVGIVLTVRDTVTGDTWTGSNTLGRAFDTITDTSALDCN